MQEIKVKETSSYQRNVALFGAHRHHRGVLHLRVCRLLHPGGDVRCRYRLGQHLRPSPGDIPSHLKHERSPLRQRKQTPLVEGYRHRGRGDLGTPQLLEPREKRAEPLLLLGRSAPHPLLGGLRHHLPGVLRQQAAVVPEVEPPALPPPVRRRHRAPNILAGPLLMKLECTTTNPQGKFLPPHSGRPYPP